MMYEQLKKVYWPEQLWYSSTSTADLHIVDRDTLLVTD